MCVCVCVFLCGENLFAILYYIIVYYSIVNFLSTLINNINSRVKDLM